MTSANSVNYNLTGMTNTGIIKYNNTTLVSSTTAKIDSSNRYTNTSQTLFTATNSTNATNATGDGTTVTIAFDTVTQQGSAFSTPNFTAPVTGYYQFNLTVGISNIGVHTQCIIGINTLQIARFSPTAVKDSASIASFSGSRILHLNANDTVSANVTVSGSTKTVAVDGTPLLEFTGVLLC